MRLLQILLLQFVAFSSGAVISGGVFAFIATVGIVPRYAIKTHTKKQIKLYETCIILGGIFGATTMMINYSIPIGRALVGVYAGAVGIFIGSMAVSLAEILDVVPILTRRGNIAYGLPFFMLSIACGKLFGSLIYHIIPGFYYS